MHSCIFLPTQVFFICNYICPNIMRFLWIYALLPNIFISLLIVIIMLANCRAEFSEGQALNANSNFGFLPWFENTKLEFCTPASQPHLVLSVTKHLAKEVVLFPTCRSQAVWEEACLLVCHWPGHQAWNPLHTFWGSQFFGERTSARHSRHLPRRFPHCWNNTQN